MRGQPEIVEVEVAGGPLTVARWPGEGPTLLLVHGISASHRAWTPVVKALPEGRFNVLAPDLRGRGASAGLPGPYGFQQHIDDLCAVIDALAAKPVIYAGHSMGAYIGVTFGATKPDLISRLVLVDGGLSLPLPQGMDPPTALEKVLGPALKRFSLEFASPADYHQFWRQHPVFADPAAWSEDVEAYFNYDLTGQPPHLKSRVVEAAVRADGLPPMEPAMVDMINRVPMPMLLLTAVRGLLNQPEPLMPVSAVENKVNAIGHLDWLEIADTDHYSITLGNGAGRVAEAITQFVPAPDQA